MRPTGSANGGFYVFDLKTARCVHRNYATPATMTQVIIDRIHEIAKAQKAPIGVTFGDFENKITILDLEDLSLADDDASDTDYKDDDTVETEDLSDFAPITEITNNQVEDVPIPQEMLEEFQEDVSVDDDFVGNDDDDYSQSSSSSDESTHSNSNSDNEDMDEIVGNQVVPEEEIIFEEQENNNEATDDDVDEDEDEANPWIPVTPRRSTRIQGVGPLPVANEDLPRNLQAHNNSPPPSDHVVLFTAGFGAAVAKLEREHHEVVMVSAVVDYYSALDASQNTQQYGVKKGIEIFGEEGVDAVLKELHQLNDLEVVSAIHPSKMTREEVKRALPYLMFLKRKRSGLVKGRGCADGRSQREFISKEEASSPTVSLYALILTY